MIIEVRVSLKSLEQQQLSRHLILKLKHYLVEKKVLFFLLQVFLWMITFSNVILNEDGTYFPGRKYIGIYPTQGKLQTQVQTFSKLLMIVNNLPIESKIVLDYSFFYNTIKRYRKS